MNKYIIIVIILVVIVGGGMAYSKFIASDASKGIETGIVKEVTITIKKDTWSFAPDYFEANQGDRILLTVVNEDDYDHGIAIESFGVSQRIPASGTITLDFVATQPGEFPFYCSVPCGDGEVEGEKRGHFDQVGRIKVNSLISVQ